MVSAGWLSSHPCGLSPALGPSPFRGPAWVSNMAAGFKEEESWAASWCLASEVMSPLLSHPVGLSGLWTAWIQEREIDSTSWWEGLHTDVEWCPVYTHQRWYPSCRQFTTVLFCNTYYNYLLCMPFFSTCICVPFSIIAPWRVYPCSLRAQHTDWHA